VVSGGTKESLKGCVMTWEGVDADVFLRFAQFMYTGAYAGFPPAETESLVGHTKGVSGTTMDVDENGLVLRVRARLGGTGTAGAWANCQAPRCCQYGHMITCVNLSIPSN
jgi:hypothetical protein